MAAVLFIASIVGCGVLLSLIPVDTLSSHSDQPDYHLVPFAGDVWGA